ncbi:MAG: ABC-F family ATP-binding cassette domain-containing protein, partial [Bacteroidota bacterium]
MNYLSAENIGKSFGDKFLFDNLSFGLDQGQKVALIGVNGSGKSTLLKIVAGVETPDQGQLVRRKGIRVAYLPQEPVLPLHQTVAEVVFASDLPEVKLIQRYEQLTQELETHPDLQDELNEVMSEIDSKNAWEYEVKINQILSQLHVNFLDRHISALSGGQRKRVAMAQALIYEPDLMIMDEPTNHLDLESIEWLEKFLATSKQSLFLVTHDRYFLDSITNEIYELDRGEIHSYKGDYAYFLEKKQEREMVRQTEADRAKSLYNKELEWLRRSPKARTTKSKSRIAAADVIKDRASYKAQDLDVKLQVKGRRIGSTTLEMKHVNKSFGELKILDNFSYTFNRRDRIG